MLDSIPVPLQAIAWSLLGSAVVLLAGRLLPRWICQVLAAAAAIASAVALWQLRSGAAERVYLAWDPINLFRVSPTLGADRLAVTVGLLACGWVAAAVLGVAGPDRPRAAWHSFLLAALAGCLALAMGSDLLTMALGSAFLDLALVGIVELSGDNGAPRRLVWPALLPGLASTLVLAAAAVRLDAQLGTASLAAPSLPDGIVLYLMAAGLLRLLILPLYLLSTRTPAGAAALILSLGTGVYLLERVELFSPTILAHPWLMTLAAVTLSFGGMLAWAGAASARRETIPPEERGWLPLGRMAWLGFVVHQTGCILAAAGSSPARLIWPWLCLMLGTGSLAVGWDSGLKRPPPALLPWMEPVRDGMGRAWLSARSWLLAKVPALQRSGGWSRGGLLLLSGIALASLVGVPLTAGARGRWPLYALLLHQSRAGLLLAILAADLFLTAAAWILLMDALKRDAVPRIRVTHWLALAALGLLTVLFGLAPAQIGTPAGVTPADLPDVSLWGLGLVYGLPWILGIWLGHVSDRLVGPLEFAQKILSLEWARRPVEWVAEHLGGAVFWLGRVGEGEGWWGWALAVLAVGILLLTGR